MPYTYILFSEIADKFYIGSTSLEVEDRLKKHLKNHTRFNGKLFEKTVENIQVF